MKSSVVSPEQRSEIALMSDYRNFTPSCHKAARTDPVNTILSQANCVALMLVVSVGSSRTLVLIELSTTVPDDMSDWLKPCPSRGCIFWWNSWTAESWEPDKSVSSCFICPGRNAWSPSHSARFPSAGLWWANQNWLSSIGLLCSDDSQRSVSHTCRCSDLL